MRAVPLGPLAPREYKQKTLIQKKIKKNSKLIKNNTIIRHNPINPIIYHSLNDTQFRVIFFNITRETG